MRLDKFLSVARIFKSRSLAGDAASSSMVFLDGLPAKPSKEIKPGSRIEIDTPLFYKKIEVLAIPTGNVTKKDAESLFKLIDERKKD
ncbi:MAG: S4 domain-containing protein [candidate division Zixibacteria bacterium]